QTAVSPSPRREAMAAEERAAAPSPSRAAMAAEAAAAETARSRSTTAFGPLDAAETGRVSAGAARGRGSNGSLLRSVRKQRIRTKSTLTAVAVAGVANAASVLASSLGAGAEVKTDPTAAGQPAAVSPEKVDAQVSGSKGSSSVEVGAPSAKQKNVEAASRSIKKSALPGCDAKQD